MVAQLCEDAKNHGIVPCTWGRCLVCELYLSTAITQKKGPSESPGVPMADAFLGLLSQSPWGGAQEPEFKVKLPGSSVHTELPEPAV